VRWFSEGQLNVSYNCLDRHVRAGRGGDPAIIWDADEVGQGQTFTYAQALEEVCRAANVLTYHGVRRGDTVAVYMPMTPDLAFIMLAAARIGAVHSVVFAGFSADSLRDRILDARSKWVVTADEGKRGGRTIPLKATTDVAVSQCACVEKVFVYQRTHADIPYGVKDVRMDEELKRVVSGGRGGRGGRGARVARACVCVARPTLTPRNSHHHRRHHRHHAAPVLPRGHDGR
jgi:acetyl-CoA synthetase